MKSKAISIALSAVMLSGCSFLAPRTQDVSARCSEADAKLFINQSEFSGFGTTKVPRNKSLSVMCTKEGYKPATMTADPTISGPGIADALGALAILLPAFGFLAPGAWRIEQSNINVSMEKLPNP